MFRLAEMPRQAVPESGSPGAGPPGPVRDLEQRIIEAIRTVRDPEIPLNIYDLGLIYGMAIGSTGDVAVRMTLTAPACPVAGTMPGLVEQAILEVDGVSSAQVELVWDPPWSLELMSDEARLELGLL